LPRNRSSTPCRPLRWRAPASYDRDPTYKLPASDCFELGPEIDLRPQPARRPEAAVALR
jgi:hypothetical protein